MGRVGAGEGREILGGLEGRGEAAFRTQQLGSISDAGRKKCPAKASVCGSYTPANAILTE